MSEYPERVVRIGDESSWGTWSCDGGDIMEYARGFSGTTVEERNDEDLIAGSRQSFSRVWLQRSVAGSVERNYTTPRILYYALGHATEDAASPYTISINGTIGLPSFSIERVFNGPDDTSAIGYMGCKVDRYELHIVAEEEVMENFDWIGSDATVNTYTFSTIATSGSFSVNPMTYCNSQLLWGGATIRLRDFRLEINNNLLPKFASTDLVCDPIAYAIREGRQAITGDFIIDTDVDAFHSFVKARSEGTIQVRLGNSNNGTLQLDIYRVAIDEFADEVSGRDDYEISIPWVARPLGVDSYDAITATWTNLSTRPGIGTITDAFL